jgi:plastocyanin
MRRSALPVLALAAFLVPASAGTSGATTKHHKPVVKKVTIHDNYYTPLKLTVKPGTYIKWVWPSDVGDTHDVNLGKRPKGVKRFHSALIATNYSFKRKLTKTGRYHIYCSLHDDMVMDVRVKK